MNLWLQPSLVKMLCEFAYENDGTFSLFLPQFFFWSSKGDWRGGKGAIIFTSIFSSSGGEKVAEEKDRTVRRLLGKYWKLGQYGRDWVVHKSDEVV